MYGSWNSSYLFYILSLLLKFKTLENNFYADNKNDLAYPTYMADIT